LVKRARDERPLVTPRSRAAWRAWLARNHARSAGIWLVYYKKHTSVPTVTYDEVVEECLCFGWIDSQVRALDAERYCQLITPRKPKSVWSKLNKSRVTKLAADGLLASPGVAKIDTAKADGSWAALDRVEALLVPRDLSAALRANAASRKAFASFSRSTRKHILTWIDAAKRPETRAKRIAETVELAAQGKKAQP
jgi:uncharacterized protein YdeI (YjbR/CyaY-like superfamily)